MTNLFYDNIFYDKHIFQKYVVAEKEIKMLKLETLFMLVNAVLYEYDPRFCLY